MITKVVAAALIFNDSVVIAKRRPRPDLGENRWEFPGGKVESGETAVDALKREIFEELEIRIQDPILKLSSTQTDQFHIELYLVKIQDQRWSLKDHEEVKLVNWKELNQVPFLVSNQSFILPLQDWFIKQGFK